MNTINKIKIGTQDPNEVGTNKVKMLLEIESIDPNLTMKVINKVITEEKKSIAETGITAYSWVKTGKENEENNDDWDLGTSQNDCSLNKKPDEDCESCQ